MPIEGMVHALEEIRRLLKPAGTLIDIHPVAEPSPVMVLRDGASRVIGNLTIRQWCYEYEQADAALNKSIKRGLFSVERKSVFESRTYFDSVEELRSGLEQDLDKYAREGWAADPELLQVERLAARAEELLRADGKGAKLIVSERAHISRLSPIA